VLPLAAAAARVRSHGEVELALNLLLAAASNCFWANRCKRSTTRSWPPRAGFQWTRTTLGCC
jgi:hypothetical protein